MQMPGRLLSDPWVLVSRCRSWPPDALQLQTDVGVVGVQVEAAHPEAAHPEDLALAQAEHEHQDVGGVEPITIGAGRRLTLSSAIIDRAVQIRDSPVLADPSRDGERLI
jgi:hypothetical protein